MSGLGFDRLFAFFSQLGHCLSDRYTLSFADALMATHNSSRVTGKYVRDWVRRWRIEEPERQPATRGWVRRWKIEELRRPGAGYGAGDSRSLRAR